MVLTKQDFWEEVLVNAQIQSDGTVGKALDVLDAVASYGRPVKFNELLVRSTFPKATLYRLLQTLTNQNMVVYDRSSGAYTLGARLMRLAHTTWKNASLAPIARPYLLSLADQINGAIHLAQLDNGQVIFIDKIKATDRYETLAKVGQVAPAYCTGVGKAMLAFLAPKRLELVLQQQSYFKFTEATHSSAKSLISELDVIRAEGVAYDRQEHEGGIMSIASPILSSEGRVMGAISIATSSAEYRLEDLSVFQPSLIETSQKIGEAATSWQFPS